MINLWNRQSITIATEQFDTSQYKTAMAFQYKKLWAYLYIILPVSYALRVGSAISPHAEWARLFNPSVDPSVEWKRGIYCYFIYKTHINYKASRGSNDTSIVAILNVMAQTALSFIAILAIHLCYTTIVYGIASMIIMMMHYFFPIMAIHYTQCLVSLIMTNFILYHIALIFADVLRHFNMITIEDIYDNPLTPFYIMAALMVHNILLLSSITHVAIWLNCVPLFFLVCTNPIRDVCTLISTPLYVFHGITLIIETLHNRFFPSPASRDVMNPSLPEGQLPYASEVPANVIIATPYRKNDEILNDHLSDHYISPVLEFFSCTRNCF